MNVVGFRHFATTLLVAGLGLALTTELSATPVNQGGTTNGQGNGNQTVGCNLFDVRNAVTNDEATDCSGYTPGNDNATQVFKLIDVKSWYLGSSQLILYEDSNVGEGSSNSLFDVVGGDDGDASKGHLTLLQDIGLPFVLTLRDRNEWAAYYFDHGSLAGTRFDFDIPGTQGADLSHASIVVDPPPDPNVGSVPEPDSLLLALGALGGIAATRRRRAR